MSLVNTEIPYISDFEFKEDLFDNQKIVISSATGTGKSTLLQNWDNDGYLGEHIVYVSNRLTLTDNICAKLGYTNYRDVKGEIFLEKTNKVAIQLESVHRIKDLHLVNTIIFDEIVNLMSHAQQDHAGNLLKLMDFPATRIFLDASITKADIKFIGRASGEMYVINNTFKPYKTKTFEVYEDAPNELYISQILADLAAGMNVYCTFGSKKKADQLVLTVQGSGMCKPHEIVYYHGDNTKADYLETGEIVQHAQKKKEDMSNLENVWDKARIVIVTPTICCGVDYNKVRFDRYYAVSQNGKQTSTPD